MRTLNIIGCGKLGKTLGYLLIQTKKYRINNILTRSINSAQECTNFLNQGTAITQYQELSAADVTLIAVKDDQLLGVIKALSTNHAMQQSMLAFHCSGAFSSEILLPLKSTTLSIASLHPIKSFSQTEKNDMSLEGRYCALEGDYSACKILQDDFENLGAKIIPIATANKFFYHIATIFSSNYFVALLEIALQLLEQSNIPREQGLSLLEPLMMGTYLQIKEHGTTKALTGPISRGDSELVAKQYQTLQSLNNDFADAYKSLGKVALDLTIKKNTLPEDIIIKLETILKNIPSSNQ